MAAVSSLTLLPENHGCSRLIGTILCCTPTAMIFLPLLRPCIMMELVSLQNTQTLAESATAKQVSCCSN
jgi:hypothetical protein